MNVKRQLTPEQFADLEAADLIAEEAHERFKDALEDSKQGRCDFEMLFAEYDLVAAQAAYDLKRVQYGVK
ncbi:hypothetical protein [Roseovarius sp.]|uniref:hypothetical protein n=1 Tax=Roseovarius sp. TaxID=1486281 RepID=UPI003B5CFF2C